MNKKPRQNLKWIVLAFLVGAVLTNGYLLGYVGGQINQPLPLLFLISAVSLGLPLFVIVIGLLIFGLYRLKRNDTKAIIYIMPAALMAGMVVSYITPAFFEPPSAAFMRGFELWVNRNVDADAIQKWIIANENYWPASDDKNGKLYDTRREELPSELPECFKKFKTQYVRLKRSGFDNSRIVEFKWGGALWHWGVVIGEPNMMMPESGEKTSPDSWIYRKTIKPNVYIYSDI